MPERDISTPKPGSARYKASRPRENYRQNMATHRIYYDDSFARDFEANVLTCEPSVHGTTPAWEVVLDETALYPTSGGQPCGHGKLEWPRTFSTCAMAATRSCPSSIAS